MTPPAPEGTLLNSVHPSAALPRPHTLLAMGATVHQRLLTEGGLDRLPSVARVDTATVVTDLTTADARQLAVAEVLFTHWGAPELTEEALHRLPRLRAVVHAAGSVKHLSLIHI